MASERTKKIKNNLLIYRLLSFACTILPLLIYIIIGFCNGEIHTGKKVFLGFTCVMAIILTLTNILLKYKLRSPLFLMMLGLHYALNDIVTLLTIISVGIFIDEFYLQPKISKIKTRLIVNKEFDDISEIQTK